MKSRAIFIFLFSIGLLSLASCTKEYHCLCTYNNAPVKNVDLGVQYQSNAQQICTSYDSTVKGIMWNCTLY